MDQIDKFIIDISDVISPYFDKIDWEFYEDKYNLKKFYLDNKSFYIDSLEWIINNAFNENPENCVKMLEFICYKYKLEFDFSIIKNEVNLIRKDNNIDFPKKEVSDLRVFLSYSSKDDVEAMRIYQIFKDANIHCFYANEEIKVGEIWDERLLEELISADIFIFLISENYKSSFWCNQEVSIGFLKFKLDNSIIMPLLVDDTKPYGIFYSIQGENSRKFNSIEDFSNLLDSESISFESAIKTVSDKRDMELTNIIEQLRYSNSFYESNEKFKDLKNKKLKPHHIQKIIDYALVNDQIMGSFEFEKIFNKYKLRYKDDLDQQSVNKVNEFFK